MSASDTMEVLEDLRQAYIDGEFTLEELFTAAAPYLCFDVAYFEAFVLWLTRIPPCPWQFSA